MNQSAKQLIWVIGASSGIGAELSLQLAASGSDVIISARSDEKLQALAALAKIGKVTARPLDVTDEQSLSDCFKQILETQRVPDTVIYNVGDYAPMTLDEFDPALFRRLMDINFMGAVNCLAAILPAMRQRGNGQILITASLSGLVGLPGASPYSAGKAALINMVESLQPEMRQAGLHLRLINPGFVKTRLTDKNSFEMPFLMSAQKAAACIVREVDSNKFEITFPLRLALIIKFLRILPYRLFLLLTLKLVKQ